MNRPSPSPDAPIHDEQYWPTIDLVTRWVWLLPGLTAGLLVYAVYVSTHQFPAFGAGLFLAMATRAVTHLPALPANIPGYTANGVPFAYPPLMFYVSGVLVKWAGIAPLVLARDLPPLVAVVALVPFYLLAEALLDNRRQAGLATLLVALAPPVLQWHISGGGIVRAPAFVFTLTGLYAFLRLFRERDRRWLGPATVAFVLTILTHPVYTVFLGLTALWMFVAFDRSWPGLRDGATVAVGGVLLAAPWWLQVVRLHGLRIFEGAAGTHGGIGKTLPGLVALFVPGHPGTVSPVLFGVKPALFNFASFGMAVITVWGVLFFLAWVAALLDREAFLAGWALMAMALVSKPRFLFAIGTLLAAMAFDRHLVRNLDRLPARPATRQVVLVGLTVLVVGGATASGVAYASSSLDSLAGSPSLPAFVDGQDLDAMSWAIANTEPSATFVVLGDAAEWFPFLTNRTILVGPWGVEWRGQSAYERQLGAFNRLSTCTNATCLSSGMAAAGVSPDYVYVPRSAYTVRGVHNEMTQRMVRTLKKSDAYVLVYQNDGVLVFAKVEPGQDASVGSRADGQPPPVVATSPSAERSDPSGSFELASGVLTRSRSTEANDLTDEGSPRGAHWSRWVVSTSGWRA